MWNPLGLPDISSMPPAQHNPAGRIPVLGPTCRSRSLQLEREGSSPPGLRLPQAKLSRNLTPVARRRVRRFESVCPARQSGLQGLDPSSMHLYDALSDHHNGANEAQTESACMHDAIGDDFGTFVMPANLPRTCVGSRLV